MMKDWWANPFKILHLALRILAASVMLITVYMKLTGAPESVFVFTRVGIEPWGRHAIGVSELLASILLLIPATAWVGAGMAVVMMICAVVLHLTVIGVFVLNDHALLFNLAIVVLVSSFIVLYQDRKIAFAQIKATVKGTKVN